ncbi:MAG TPA: acyloxyacyl hydrolase [Methylomirabilota bacterium]|nr:acyloxyacyl hydrolase [Methylomirabilota bacterium]
MAIWHWRFWGAIVGGFVLWACAPANAADLLPTPGTWSFGPRFGYSESLDNKGVDMVHGHVHIGYTLFKGQPWVFPAGSFEIGVEPFGSGIVSLKKNTASGSTEYGLALPVLTYYFNLGTNVYPYVIGGLGVMYKDLRGYNLGGKFTFMETAGLGLSYFLSDSVALSAEWRFRHMSNANIYKENAGLNSSIFLAGFSYYLPNQ